MPNKKLYLILGFGILCLSASSIFVKQLAMRGLPLLGIACYRMVITTIILSIPALIFHIKEIKQLSSRQWLALIWAGSCLALHFGTWTLSLNYIPVARSVLLVTCHPIFTLLASRIFLGETFSWRNLWAILLAFLGIIIIFAESWTSIKGNVSFLIGDLLALAGAVTIVGYIIVGRRLRTKIPIFSYAAIVYAICALVLWPAALASGTSWQLFNGQDLLLLLALAIIPTIGGHTVFNFLLKDVSATMISIAFLGEPLGAALLAWLLWRQIPSHFTILGGICVLIGIYLVELPVNSPANSPAKLSNQTIK